MLAPARLAVVVVLAAGACNLRQFFDDPRCYTSADCFDGKVCSADLCVGVGSLGSGRRCWATRDCQDGQTCQIVPETKNGEQTLDQRCLPAGMGAVDAPCQSALDCAAGLRCELVAFSGQCRPSGTHDRDEPCTTTADCLSGLACGPQGTCLPYPEAYPAFAGVACPAETGPFRAHFELPRASAPLADFFRLPFPSDVRVTNGKLDLTDFPRPGPTPLGVDLVQLYVDALTADFDGFSSVAPVTFRFSGDVDEASLPAAATLVDVTPGATAAEIPARATLHAARTKYSCANRVVVEHAAGDVLAPRHTYAIILRGVRGPGGGAAAQDADLAAVLGAQPAGGDPVLTAAWQAHARRGAWLTAQGIAAATVQAATVFTVGDPVATMAKVRVAIDQSPVPTLADLTLCDAGVASPCADGSPERVCGAASADYYEVQGHVAIPIFQEGTPPYLHPSDGGGISATAPAIVRTEQVCFALTVPKHPPPVGGWPLVVYAHGTGGSMRSFINEGIASTLAAGTPSFAVFSYDGVEHGARKHGSTIDSKELVFNVLNPRAARDNNLQGGADVLQLLRLGGISVPASVTGAPVSFDAGHVLFFGHSQGSNVGLVGLAHAPGPRAVVFSGAGGGVVDGILTKTSPVDIAAGMKILLGEPLDRTHPAMVVFQTYFDRSDPMVYAPLFVRRPPTGAVGRHVLHTYGLGDTYAPPTTLGNVTKALGVPVVGPVLEAVTDPVAAAVGATARPIIADVKAGDGQNVTAATFQYAPAGYDGHFVALENPDAIADWTTFFQSYLLIGTPHVP